MEKHLYLTVNLFILSFLLIKSFELKVRNVSLWYALFPVLLVTCIIFQPLAKPFISAMITTLLVLALFNLDKMDTSVNYFLGVMSLRVYWSVFKDKYMVRFIFLFFAHPIPNIIYAGVSNRSITSQPVVAYNNAKNLGDRIWMVSIKDTIYSMSVLLRNVSLVEYFRNRKTFQEA